MQLKRKALVVVVALVAIVASASAFASIPPSEILSPAITRTSFDLASPARPEASEVLPLVEHLRGALEEALPASEQLSSLAETRVRAFGDLAPFEQQLPSELSRALHQAYADLTPGNASGESFGAGDPVNNRDPLGEGILDDLRFATGQYYTDVATRAAVTGKAIKGIGTSVVKTVVGIAATANLIHEASKVGNVQAQMQVVEAVVQTRDAVAQWGTQAGYAIAEPELIGQAVAELKPDEFAEVTFDATILTASLIAPAAKAPPATTAAASATTTAETAATTLAKYRNLGYVENVAARASQSALNRALNEGLSGRAAGLRAEVIFENYAYQLNQRMMAANSPFRITLQPAADAATGARVMARTQGSFSGRWTANAKRLDYGFYTPYAGGANSAPILAGGDFTVTPGGAMTIPAEYSGAFPWARIFGIDPKVVSGPR